MSVFIRMCADIQVSFHICGHTNISRSHKYLQISYKYFQISYEYLQMYRPLFMSVFIRMCAYIRIDSSFHTCVHTNICRCIDLFSLQCSYECVQIYRFLFTYVCIRISPDLIRISPDLKISFDRDLKFAQIRMCTYVKRDLYISKEILKSDMGWLRLVGS